MVAEAQHRPASSRAQALAAHTAQWRWTRPKRKHPVVAGCAETGYVSSKSSRHERWSALRCGGRRFQGSRPTCEQMPEMTVSVTTFELCRRNRCCGLEDIKGYQAFEALSLRTQRYGAQKPVRFSPCGSWPLSA